MDTYDQFTFGQFTFGQFTFGHLTFRQLYIWSILHIWSITTFEQFTFCQLIQFVNWDNGLKFGQLKISVSSQIQHGKLGSC